WCIFDLYVYFLHTSANAAAYTSPPSWPDEPGFFRKIGLLGALLSGLFSSYADTALAWCMVGLLVLLATRARAATVLLSPLLLLLFLYCFTPSVFFNTHLIFQRLPLWGLMAALLALPPLAPGPDALGRRWARMLSGLYLVLVPLHLALHHQEVRGALVVLEKTPPGVCVTGVIEEARTVGIRLPTLTHAAALAVPLGAGDEAFSFARWMGLPVVYRPRHRPPYPERSWEHDGRRYDPETPLARRCPVVLLRSGWAEEPTAHLLLRVFGRREARVLARSGAWLLVDTGG
ncbi:MAG: hypothetical protein NZX77_20450, partial [Polyangiaceae bacterium]|nr:hypothetical protein [Polyangiaceae bacterium]